MTIKVALHTVLFFLFTFLLVGCKEDNLEKINLNTSTIEYFEFKDGTVWEYALESDTAQIAEKINIINYYRKELKGDMIKENMSYMLEIGGVANYEIRCETTSDPFRDIISVVTYNDPSGNNKANPIIINVNGKFSMSSSEPVEILPVYETPFFSYSDVMKVVVKNHLKFAELYFSKDAGLITKVQKDGKVFHLKKFNIVR